MTRRIGLLVGRERSFPDALIAEVARRDAGVVAEYASFDLLRVDAPPEYDVLVDRISHDVPCYQPMLKVCALRGTRVFLHWRNATRDSPWITDKNAPVPDAGGGWYNVIPNADPQDSYEAYATSETWAYGPCAYAGTGSIQLCAPLSLIGPATGSAELAGSLLVGGAAPDAGAAADLFLHWRSATRQSAWTIRPLRAAEAHEGVSFPREAPGNWYSVIPNAGPAERYQVYLASRTAVHEPCTYPGDGRPTLCSPIAWIQPQATAGFGPPGSLIVAGVLPAEKRGAPVFLHWRNATAGSAWTTELAAPTPDARGVWYNAIPNADLAARYEVTITAPTAASERCLYAGDGIRNSCP